VTEIHLKMSTYVTKILTVLIPFSFVNYSASNGPLLMNKLVISGRSFAVLICVSYFLGNVPMVCYFLGTIPMVYLLRVYSGLFPPRIYV